MKKIKKTLACIVSAVTMITGISSLSANAMIVNYPNEFILNYAPNIPNSDIQTKLTNYATMNSTDKAITIKLEGCTTSSNTKSCRFTVPRRADSETTWSYFSYAGQKKDIALKSHGTDVEFTCELYKTNSSQGYGVCHFSGTAN